MSVLGLLYQAARVDTTGRTPLHWCLELPLYTTWAIRAVCGIRGFAGSQCNCTRSVCGGSLTRQLRVNNSVEHTRRSGVFELALHGLSGARNTRVTGAFLFVEQRSVVVCDRVLRPHKRRAVPCPRRLPRSRDLRSLPFRYHVSWPLGAIGDLVAAGSLARQLRVNNSVEHPPALASSGSLCTDWSGARNTRVTGAVLHLEKRSLALRCLAPSDTLHRSAATATV